MKHDQLINIRSLTVSFPIKGDLIPVVDQVSFSILSGEILALVGESGCGKSQIALALMGLNSQKAVVKLQGEGLERTKAMIFQEPMTALNPVISIGEQVREAIPQKKERTKDKVYKLLRSVRITRPEKRYNQYPHEFSGGMRQRVLIAAALARQPQVLIADEPTTALDVTIQSQIIALLRSLNQEMGLSILFITHDLDLVKKFGNRIMVMYAGRIVESGPTDQVLNNSRHPYTADLLRLAALEKNEEGKFPAIPGAVPTLRDYPSGCRYHPRCVLAKEDCKTGIPLKNSEGAHHWDCNYSLPGRVTSN